MSFVNITAKEMADFLEPLGFKLITPDIDARIVTKELVWGRRQDRDGMKLSVRVFSGINPDGNSREAGNDAIRVTVGHPNGKNWTIIGTHTRVHRVAGWRDNLAQRLVSIDEIMPKHKCPKCSAPMVGPKKGGRGWFYGCCTFPTCRGLLACDQHGNLEQKAPVVANNVRPKFQKLVSMMDLAAVNLQAPKFDLLAGTQPVRLARAKGKYEGCIHVNDGGSYGNSVYFGRIDRDGTFDDRGAPAAVLAFLHELNADPAKVIGEQGRLLGRCCFCKIKLSDERSLAAGYGEICAEHYGLPWGERRLNALDVAQAVS